jgi:tubulin polyglutamylase TTLL5
MKRAWFGGKREAIQDLYFREALDPNQWTEGDANDWHTCWFTGMPKPAAFEQLDAHKSINHIPGNNSLTVKSNLYATLAASHERLLAQEGPDSARARRLRFFPTVYSMPPDYHAFLAAAREAPGKRWILKPKNGSRGKDIRLVTDPAAIPAGDRWMVQEYLDRPHTMFGRKYVLRLYVLITSVEPLRVYLYHEGSAKLASAAYDPDDSDNLYAHLTNPDINATNETNASPVVFVNLDQYRQWLREQGHDDTVLFTRLRDMVVLTALSAREKMRQRLQGVTADTSGCYELLGLDCLVDGDLNPWLLECNLSPSLETCAAPEDGGDTEARNKRQMIEDVVRLLGLNEDAPERAASTEPERLIDEAEAERRRAGGFDRVFPASDAADYLPFLPMPRLADMVLADHASGQSLARPIMQPRATQELIADDRLSLYSELNQTLYTPNPSAAWIWLQAVDGADPDRIAAELAMARGEPEGAVSWTTRREVWDVLADWAVAGLLVQKTSTATPHGTPTTAAAAPASRPPTRYAVVGQASLAVTMPDWGLDERLHQALGPVLTASEPPTTDSELVVLTMAGGYAIARCGALGATGLSVAAVLPTLLAHVRAECAGVGSGSVLPGALVPTGIDDQALWVLPPAGDDGDMALALALAERFGYGYTGGIQLSDGGTAHGLGLPVTTKTAPRADTTAWRHGLDGETPYHLAASTAPSPAAGYTVVGVVLPATGGDETDDGAPVSVHELMPTLVDGLATARDTGLDAASAGWLWDWLGQRALVTAAASRTAAIDRLIERFAAAGAHQGASAS